ncbi:MAG: hypothetical protein IM500_17835 [Microcystis sp. M179S2]|nr:hypothetical protein [Microcystis sp. M179S2]
MRIAKLANPAAPLARAFQLLTASPFHPSLGEPPLRSFLLSLDNQRVISRWRFSPQKS